MSRPLLLALALALAAGAAVAAEPAKPFGIVLVFTDKSDALFRRFDHPDGVAPDLDSIEVAPRRKRLAALVLFRNCKPGPEHLQLGRRALGLEIDTGDPAGTWRITATARDRVANVESSAEWRFQVEPE